MNKIILPDFIIIPFPLLEDKNITLIDERLYGIIYWFSKLKNEKCTASNQTLASLIKSTPTTTGNSLTKLERLGYIQRIFKDEIKRVRKEIIPLVVFRKVSLTDDTLKEVSLTDDMVSLSDDTHVSLTDEQKKKRVKKNSKEELAVAKAPAFSTLIKDHFIKTYEAKFNNKPAIDFGKDLRVVNKSKGLFPDINRAYKLIEDFVKSQKAYDNGNTLSVCFSTHTINQWQAGNLEEHLNLNI